MDKLDKQIIEHLSSNSRQSFRKIADATGKSTDTIINRYNAMVKDGVIRGNSITLDRDKLGFEGVAVFLVVTGNNVNISDDEIMEEISKIPNVLLVSKTMGAYDLVVLVAVKGLVHFEKVCVDIVVLPGVKDINSCYWTGNKQVNPKYFNV